MKMKIFNHFYRYFKLFELIWMMIFSPPTQSRVLTLKCVSVILNFQCAKETADTVCFRLNASVFHSLCYTSYL